MAQALPFDSGCYERLLNDICKHVDEKILEAKEEESTVSQCVRKLFSSKQRPPRFIKQLLEGYQLNCLLPLLQSASQKLLSDHISLITDGNSPLSTIKLVTVSIFFIQVVLESAENAGEKESMKIAAIVMQALQQKVLDCSAREKDEKATTEDDTRDVGKEMPYEMRLSAFYVGALLRAINPYASSLPILLSTLWKNISFFVSINPNLPPEVVENVVLALLTYLEEGERACLDSGASIIDKKQPKNSQNLQDCHFRNKIFGFLLTRLAIILPVYVSSFDESDDSSILDSILNLSIRILGVPQAMTASLSQNDTLDVTIHSTMSSFVNLEKKAEQCIRSSCIRDDALVKESLMVLLRTKSPTSKSTDFEKSCWKFGKLGALLIVMKQTPALPVNAELLVVTAEQALFSLLPQCHCLETQPLVASQVVTLSTRATTLLATTTTKSKLINALLLKLLCKSCCHPVSREAVVSMVYNHVLELSIARGTQSPRSALDIKERDCSSVEALISLMVGFFFDHRSTTSHREAIGGVLSRLLVTKSCGVSKYVQRKISIQLIAFLNNIHNESRNDKEESGIVKTAALALSDWVCILRIVDMVDFSANDCLQSEVLSLKHELQLSHEQVVSCDDKIFHLGHRASHYIALILCSNIQQGGLAPRILTKWFLRETKRRKKGAMLTQNGAVLTYALLQFLGRTIASNQMDDVLISTATLLTWSIQQSRQLMVSQKEDAGSTVALAAGSLLGNLGGAITASTQSVILQRIAACFNALFTLGPWTISVNTMNSLLQFASALTSNQDILPKCLPAELQGWFKSRLKAAVHPSFKQTNFKSVHTASKRRAIAKIENESYFIKNDSPFETMSLNTLSQGSYLISMPTLEGRKALVIFPPGDQSLEDIKYMLQKDSLDGENIRRLNHVGVIESDGGCQLFSSEYRQL